MEHNNRHRENEDFGIAQHRGTERIETSHQQQNKDKIQGEDNKLQFQEVGKSCIKRKRKATVKTNKTNSSSYTTDVKVSVTNIKHNRANNHQPIPGIS